MRRTFFAVVVCVVALVSVAAFSVGRPEGRSVQVSFGSVMYGLESISTPTLDRAGVECVPKPVAPVGANEEWPDTGKVPDPAYRDALEPELREAFDCLVNCLPADQKKWSGDPLSSARPCFEDVVVDLTLSVGLVETFKAVGAILDTYPKLTFFCHKAGHKAGEAAFAAGVPLEVSLPAVGDRCVHGAMHGILDGFGLSHPTLEDFDKVAAICVGLGQYAGGCADGMGHAAWDTFGSFADTSEACGKLPVLDLRYSCDEGVLMRRYERIGSIRGVATADYVAHTEKLRADCEQWAAVSERVDEPGGPGAGCWMAVQYMLWEPLVGFSRMYPEGRWRDVPNMQELLDVLRETCASFGPIGEDMCRRRDGYHVATAADYRVEDFEPLCSMLHDRVAECVAGAKELTAHNSSG